MLPYEAAVDISDLVHLEAVMEELRLGPNGGLVYCMEFLQKNLDWLQEKLAPLEKGAPQAAVRQQHNSVPPIWWR